MIESADACNNSPYTLRKKLRRIRRSLSPTQQRDNSSKIFKHLKQELFFLKAQNIAFYWPTGGEVSLSALIGIPTKTWFLPLVSDARRSWEKKRLVFQAYDKQTPSSTNKYGILEPLADARKEILPQMLDLVLLPLLGFDREGNRLGMGKGYYDRTFYKQSKTWRTAKLVGIAHSVQECDRLLARKWDIPLDVIITENEIIRCDIARSKSQTPGPQH